jgi:hypothetical protein
MLGEQVRGPQPVTDYDRTTLRCDNLTSLQVGPVTIQPWFETTGQNGCQGSLDRLNRLSPRASVHAAPCKHSSSPPHVPQWEVCHTSGADEPRAKRCHEWEVGQLTAILHLTTLALICCSAHLVRQRYTMRLIVGNGVELGAPCTVHSAGTSKVMPS